MPDRIIKVNELIKQQLAQVIAAEIEFPLGSLATITKVDTSADLKQAKIYVSILPIAEKNKVINILNKEAINLYRLLNKKIKLKNIPKLIFLFDASEEQAEQINQLLDNLK